MIFLACLCSLSMTADNNLCLWLFSMSRRREDYATSRSTLNIDLGINSVELRYESRLAIDLCTYLNIF